MANRVLLQPGPEIGATATMQLVGKVIAIDADGTGFTVGGTAVLRDGRLMLTICRVVGPV